MIWLTDRPLASTLGWRRPDRRVRFWGRQVWQRGSRGSRLRLGSSWCELNLRLGSVRGSQLDICVRIWWLLLPIRLGGRLLLLGLVWYVVGLLMQIPLALILPRVPPLAILIGLVG